jgi:hypothetical protein
MAKNKLRDLSDHLFERIEWLADRDHIKGDALDAMLEAWEKGAGT